MFNITLEEFNQDRGFNSWLKDQHFFKNKNLNKTELPVEGWLFFENKYRNAI